jgi:hypothetical protein
MESLSCAPNHYYFCDLQYPVLALLQISPLKRLRRHLLFLEARLRFRSHEEQNYLSCRDEIVLPRRRGRHVAAHARDVDGRAPVSHRLEEEG